MARLGRYFLVDQPLHVIQRGNNREPICFDAVERQGADPNTPRLTYLARVRLKNDTINVDGREVNLSPGTMASVEIKTGTRKIVEFVLSPLMKMGGEAGRER